MDSETKCYVAQPPTVTGQIDGTVTEEGQGFVFPTVTDAEGVTTFCYFGQKKIFGVDEEAFGTPEELARCIIPEPTASGVPRGKVLFLVGDSHCSVLAQVVQKAVEGRMRVQVLCRSGTHFTPRQFNVRPPDWWIPTLVAGLKTSMQPGDALAIIQLGGKNDFDFLRDSILPEVIRPVGAKLVLVGDSPWLSRPASTCEQAPWLCDYSDMAAEFCEPIGCSRDAIEAELAAFASSHDDVFFFSQMYLWTDGAEGEKLWGNIPGTNQRAYMDDNHLLVSIARAYLWPYFCSAFSSFGLY